MTLSHNHKSTFYILLTFTLLVCLDQYSKSHIVDFFLYKSESNTIKLLPSINIVLAWNKGISFGIFHDLKHSQIIFTIISIIITFILSIMLLKTKINNEKFAFIIIISGGVGNIIDRFKYGAVVDFIDIYLYQFHWPAFNFADAYICIGVMLLILQGLREQKF